MMHAPLRVGDRYHGFRVLRLQSLPEPKAVAVDCLHERTGLRLFHFFNQDPNSLFAFAFPSYPENDCGLPHIVEHCVLSGSEKYPLKDAFNAFSKGSVNTYMNALTYADKTLFPASSMVEADYFHLFSLYADSLFHPLLSREIFEQEGIRIEADAEGNPLPKGVVYNEMLGDYSDSDSLMFNAAFRTLLSGTPYAFDSGGNPESIVTLTYEAFLDFYRKHYAPYQCHLFLYGSIPTERQLRFLAKEVMGRLPSLPKGFTPAERGFSQTAAVLMPVQASSVSRVRVALPTNAGTPAAATPAAAPASAGAVPVPDTVSAAAPALAAVTESSAPAAAAAAPTASESPSGEVNWVWSIDREEDAVFRFSMLIVDQLLLGNSESLLAKRLLQSGIGEDLSSLSGLFSELIKPLFFCGMTGVAPERMPEFRPLLYRSLQAICDDGIDPLLIEGVFRRLEFATRSQDISPAFGRQTMKRVFRGWLYWDRPERFLFPSKAIADAHRQWEARPRYFEELIEQTLLHNPHAVQVEGVPDPDENLRAADRLQALSRLRFRQQQEADPHFPQSAMNRFAAYQNRADDPRLLKRVPRLRIRQLSLPFPALQLTRRGVLSCFEASTGGLDCFILNFNINGLSKEEWMLLPLFFAMSLNAKTASLSAEAVMTQKQLKIGGVELSNLCTPFYPTRDRSQSVLTCQIRCKGLSSLSREGIPFLLSLLKEADFHHHRKLRELILSAYHNLQSDIRSDSYSFALNRIVAAAAPVKAAPFWMEGLPQYELMKAWKGLSAGGLERLSLQLDRLRRRLLVPDRLSFCAVGEAPFFDFAQTQAASFLREVTPAPDSPPLPPVDSSLFEPIASLAWLHRFPNPISHAFELFVLPSGNACNLFCLSLPPVGDPIHAPLALLCELLTSDRLWNDIRMRGGAYGASAFTNERTGTFILSTYRDPNLQDSYRIFKEAVDFYSTHRVTDKEAEAAKMPLLGKWLKPHSPLQWGFRAFSYSLSGITDADREANRKKLIRVTPNDIREAARWLQTHWEEGIRVSFCGKAMWMRQFTEAERRALAAAGQEIFLSV